MGTLGIESEIKLKYIIWKYISRYTTMNSIQYRINRFNEQLINNDSRKDIIEYANNMLINIHIHFFM